MSADKVSGDSRFDAGLRRLAKELSGSSETPIYAELRRRLIPLLEKAEILLADEMMKRSLMPVETWYKVEALRKELDTWK